MVVDDYGHHPTEIAAVIAAARAGIDRRVVVVFQPHRYSRTRQLLRRVRRRRSARADEVVLTDIYAAGEAPIAGVTVEAVAEAVRARAGCPVHVVKSARRSCPAAVRGDRAAGRSRRSRWARARSGRVPTASSRRSRAGGPAASARPAMSVKAPAEKNFRRAKVEAGQAQAAATRACRRGASRAGRRCARRSSSTPATARRSGRAARRRCRCGTSSCTATCGCRAARCRRSSTGCAARAS